MKTPSGDIHIYTMQVDAWDLDELNSELDRLQKTGVVPGSPEDEQRHWRIEMVAGRIQDIVSGVRL